MRRFVKIYLKFWQLLRAPMFDEIKSTSPETIPTLNKTIPMHRFAKSEEIAEAVLFLASPRSSYIVGADLVMDGGLCAIFPVKG